MQPIYDSGRKLRTGLQTKVDSSSRRVSATVAVFAGLGSVVSLVWAALTSSASILLLAGLGVVLGALSLWIIGRQIAKDVNATANPWIGPVVVAGGLLLAVVSVTIAARLETEWVILVLIGLAAAGLIGTMIGILILNRSIAGEAVANPKFWVVASAIVFFTALLSIGTGTPALLTTIALVIWVVALTTLKISLTPLIRQDTNAEATHRRAKRVALVSVGFVVVGLVLLIWNPVHRRLGPEPFSTSFSISVILLALSTAAIGAVNVDVSRVKLARRAVTIVGVILTVAGTLLTFQHLPKWPVVVIFVCLLLFMSGAFFVLKGEGLAFLLAIGLILALVLVPRVGDDATAENPVGDGTLVILGDSFTSGEGASEYLPLTNTQDPEGNWCRRSPVSYGQLTGELFAYKVHNFSCSGAKTVDILDRGQFERPDSDVLQKVPGQFTQLESLSVFGEENAGDNVELVLLSIGGNDAGFSTVVKACLLPGDCGTESAEWLGAAAGIGDAITTTYRTITEVMPRADVVVIPYPSYVGTEACGLALTTSEIDFVRVLIKTINAQSQAAADRFPQVHYFDEIDRAYLNHSLCSGRPGANFLNLLPRSGDLLERFAPDSWHNGTAHPNDRGHRCTTVVLSEWLQGQEWFARTAATEFDSGDCEIASRAAVQAAGESEADFDIAPMVPDPLDPGSMCVADVVDAGSPGDEPTCFDGDAWVSAQLDATAGALALPFGLLIFGGLLVALEAVWLLRRGLADRLKDPEANARALDIFVPEAPSAYETTPPVTASVADGT